MVSGELVMKITKRGCRRLAAFEDDGRGSSQSGDWLLSDIRRARGGTLRRVRRACWKSAVDINTASTNFLSYISSLLRQAVTSCPIFSFQAAAPSSRRIFQMFRYRYHIKVEFFIVVHEAGHVGAPLGVVSRLRRLVRKSPDL